MFDEWTDALFVTLVVAAALMLASLMLVMLVWLPVTMHAQAECLREGYPRAHVTYRLDRYCSTLDGAVTVKVTKQQ